jgi:hypothetical protein
MKATIHEMPLGAVFVFEYCVYQVVAGWGEYHDKLLLDCHYKLNSPAAIVPYDAVIEYWE